MRLDKVGIIGCGFVGATIAFTLMQSGLFTEMVLIDVDKNKAEGEAMDIGHGIAFSGPIDIYAGEYKDLSDAGSIIITAGVGQKPGETRLDLVNRNVSVYKSIIADIKAYVDDCLLLVVSNPVDILTWVAYKLSGFPSAHVFGSGTVLDSARLKYEIGNRLDVDPRSVHSFIIGEHGDSEVTAWSSVIISGISIDEFCRQKNYPSSRQKRKEISDEVKNSAYEIIEKKSATYYGIAMAVRRICESIVHDEKSILTVSCMQDKDSVSEGIYIGMPAIVGKDGVEQSLKIQLDEEETDELMNSVEALKSVIESIDI